MKSLRSGNNPGSRIDVGNAVLASARAVNNEVIAPRIQNFEKAHARYVAAEERVRKTDEAVQQQIREVGEADAAQDAALMMLANALVGDGLPRVNPFKPLGFDSPSKLAKLGYGEEAKEAQRLARALQSRSGVGKTALAAAKALAVSAQAMEKRLAELPKLTEARTAAIRERDTVGHAWEAQVAGLKLAAKMAEADGESGLYEALFTDDSPKKAKKKKSPAPEKTPPTT